MTTPFEKDLRHLLDHLCVKLGFCLAPEDSSRLIENPPAAPEAFAREIFVAEGIELGGAPPHLYREVLDLVTATYDETAAPTPSTTKELQESWHCTRTYLDKAQGLLGDQRPRPERVQEYLNNNELELALDELEHLGERLSPRAEFWVYLRSAAEEMRLADHYERLHRRVRQDKA